MGCGPRRALIAAGLCACAAVARAQNPPAAAPQARADTAPRDSLTPRLLYDETFTSGSSIVPRVTLTAGLVYRIQTEPGEPVSVTYSQRPTAPPLLLVPLEGAGPSASGSASFLVVPQTTAEYRIDIQWTQTGPVRLTIWTDPKEMSRWARMRAATRGQPAAGVNVRAVYIGPFVRPGLASPNPGSGQGLASASGVEACLAAVPRGGWLSGPIGGCVLAIGRFVRPDSAGGLWLLAIEPRYQLTPTAAPLEQSVVFTLAIATSVGQAAGTVKTDYFALGLAYQVATRLLGRWYGTVAAGLARLQVLGSGIEPKGKASIVPHLEAGVELRF